MLIGFGMFVAVGMIVGVEFGGSGEEVETAVDVNVDRKGISVTGCGVVIPQDESRIDKAATTAKIIFCIVLYLLSQFYQFHLNFK